MLVDDKLAKEKLARICDQPKPECCGNFQFDENSLGGTICCGNPDIGEYMDGIECAQLIRNTDLTDCQQQKAKSDE